MKLTSSYNSLNILPNIFFGKKMCGKKLRGKQSRNRLSLGKLLLAAVAMIACSQAASATEADLYKKPWMPRTTGQWLITEPEQLTSNAISVGWEGRHIPAGELVTNTAVDKFLSADEGFKTGHENDGYFYIQVKLQNPLYLEEDEDLVIYTRRWERIEKAADGSVIIAGDKHPTTFKVEASVDGTTWNETVVYAFMLYRGPGTNEFSSRIHTKGLEEKGYQYLRFSVTANNTKSVIGETETRLMNVGDFNIMKIKKTDNYTDQLIDRLRTVYDYSFKFDDYRFENTMGIIDPANHPADKNVSGTDPYYGGNLRDYTDWSGWSPDGKWTKDAEALEAAGITIPDYTMLNTNTDPDIMKGERQPTHVKEHILYAIPGDVLALYPFYQTDKNQYQEVFSHWYDYTTGGHCRAKNGYRLLDFLIDPGGIFLSNDYGYYGGSALQHDYPTTMAIYTVEDFKKYASVLKYYPNISAVLMADLDFKGEENPFRPLGTWGKPFTGYFEGNGHVIKNIKLNLPNTDDISVFGYISGNAKITNLILTGLEVTGKNYVGGLACGIVENQNASPTLRNVVVQGNVTGNFVVSGLFGRQNAGNSPTTVENCAFIGEVKGGSSVWSLGGKNEGNTYDNFSNCYTYATTTPADQPMFASQNEDNKAVNCYDKTGKNNAIKIVGSINSEDFLAKLNLYGEKWKLSDKFDFPIPIFDTTDAIGSDHISTLYHNQNWYGRVATFFQPRDITKPDGLQHNLEKKEYVIAADFVQEFNRGHNIDEKGKRIVEPSIAYRHIFRIRDGKTFADENMATVEGNRAYVEKNRRSISAPAGRPFQIRFDSPLPQEQTTRSRWYYKISNTDYRRVCMQEIRVWKKVGNDWVIDNTGLFEPAEIFNGEGSREINGVKYNICGGGGKYARMLNCDEKKTAPGEYMVRLIGKDINGNVIMLPHEEGIAGEKEELYTEEFHITFLPEQFGSVLTEKELTEKHPEQSPEYLGRPEVCGDPTAVINFDEYRLLENLPNASDYFSITGNNRYFKWPRPWNQLDYSFGYNEPRDYNMYRIANQMDKVVYSKQIKDEQRFDRLYAETGGKEQGYFFYCNAAADPGIMAKLEIRPVCLGSTITVSAWAIEGSGDEVCNIAFNVIAVVKHYEEGATEQSKDRVGNLLYDRVPVHTFTSGYLPTLGKWYHIYYKFIPDVTELKRLGIDANKIYRYEIELENNCKSSEGADYAIDDIRAYVIRPQIYATQTSMFCRTMEEDSRATDIRIETPFEVLLQNFGKTAATTAPGELIDIYYTFLDKEVYDKTLNETHNADKAKDAATLVYEYNHGDGKQHKYGRLQFNTFFESNPEYDKNAHTLKKEASRMLEEGTKTQMIVFDTKPQNKDIMVGKQYYVVLSLNEHTEEDRAPMFDLEDNCAKKAVFRVKGAHITKIDGEAHYDNQPFEVCEGQQPVAQVEIQGKFPDGSVKPVGLNPYIDWYAGGYDDFLDEMCGETPLSEILNKFREVYPYADTAEVEEADGLSKEWIEYLQKLTTPVVNKDEQGNPVSVTPAKLTLHKTSYVFPPVVLPEGSDDATIYVVAIPLNINLHEEEQEYLICTDPTEVALIVHRRAPLMLNGFKELDALYPAELQDVPLRIGLTQIKGATPSTGSLQALESHNVVLEMPIRSVTPVTDKVQGMKKADDYQIYLVQTNDPAYKALLGKEDEAALKLPVVGIVRDIKAKKDLSGNYANIVFTPEFTFREGYYYRLRFSYKEDYSGLGISESALNVCSGQLVCTLKVVPEYQIWTGEADSQAANRNWNNDANWRRVTSAELLIAGEEEKTAAADFVTDGSNENLFSYAPLNFTKVIIPHIEPESRVDYPRMFDFNGESKQYVGSEVRTYKWEDLTGNADTGEATKYVAFDMAAESVPENLTLVWCRPWYANTCEQIHFNAGAQLYRQNYFTAEKGNYKRAWVDFDLTPERWYTMGMPLQGIVAGDMYLPSPDGFQQTQLFKDINFVYGDYDRFNPAVYQRSWNKASALVYELQGSVNYPKSNVAVAAAWSNVYNDVEVPYSGGEGFSIKTNLAGLSTRVGSAGEAGEVGGEAGGGEGEEERTVRFRLPKADTEYLYFNQDGTEWGNRTPLNRGANPHHLFPMDKELEVTVSSATVGDYFLVGNPFITRLDMAKFLEANKEQIAQSYWILSDKAQAAAVYDEIAGAFFSNEAGDFSTVGVAQGFFVKALKPAGQLTVKFTAEMMNETKSSLPMTRASFAGGLTVTALTAGEPVSAASVRLSEDASDDFDTAEDAALLFDPSLELPSTVYTVAGNQAVAVNTRRSLADTEIGLIAGEDTETTLVFTGTDLADELKLLDTDTGELTPIYEGMEYEVKGNVSGRLFIVGPSGEQNADGISVIVADHTVTVASPVSEVSARVYDTLGRLVGDYAEGTQVLTFSLGEGIYIVNAQDSACSVTRKIYVK